MVPLKYHLSREMSMLKMSCEVQNSFQLLPVMNAFLSTVQSNRQDQIFSLQAQCEKLKQNCCLCVCGDPNWLNHTLPGLPVTPVLTMTRVPFIVRTFMETGMLGSSCDWHVCVFRSHVCFNV